MLSENVLMFDHRSYPTGVFAHLSDLQTITLNNNFLYCPYSFESFQLIVKELPPSLQKIHIDIPCEKDFSYILQKFKNLIEIGLFRDNYCGRVISNNSLYHLRKLPLTKLMIRFDNLTKVEPLAFSWFKDLTHLDLSKTNGMEVNDLKSAWIGLERTKLAVLSLSSFKQNPIDSDPVFLDSDFFEHLKCPYLQALHLDNTNIYGVGDLSLLGESGNLEYLTFAYNSMGHDQMWKLTEYTQVLKKLSYLDLSFQAKSNEPIIFSDLSPQMTTLNMSGFNTCFREHTIAEIILKNRNSLTLFEFRKNSMTHITKMTIEKPNASVLLTVDFSQNKLSRLSPKLLTDSISAGLRLEGLLVSDNHLGEQFDIDDNGAFDNYRELKVLDLSINGIKSIAENTFRNLFTLEILNLSSNSLTSLHFKFAHMTKLRLLDLTNNRLSYVSSEARIEFNSFGLRHSNITVNLAWNLFECPASLH